MYRCNDCKELFKFPEVKRPDAGNAHARDIYGSLELKPLLLCPECMSNNIEKRRVG